MIAYPYLRFRLSCIAAGLLALSAMQGIAAAQTTKLPDTKLEEKAITFTKPVALSEYRQSALFKERHEKYDKQWTNPHTEIHYSAKSHLDIKMVKNPSTANGASHITKKIVKVGKDGPSPEHEGWVCSTHQITLTASSSSFMNNDYSDSNSHIYPGAIFTFKNFYGGQYKEQDGDRNPMRLVTGNPNINGDSGVLVKNPGIEGCRDGIASIFRRFTGSPGNEASSYDVYQSYNSSDLNMQVSGGASGYGVSFSDAFSSSSSNSTLSMTVDAKKAFFSISALPPKEGFFKNAKIEETPDLMVVSNVVYGVRVLANVSITFNSTKDANDFKASYSGYGFNANAAFDYLNSHTSTASAIHAYVVGGPGSSSVSFSMNDLKRQIDKIMEGVTYENARPIGYQFMDMAGDVIGSESATDTFEVRQCAPSTDDPKIVSMRAHFLQGTDGKDYDTNFNVYVYPGEYAPAPNRDDRVGAIFGYESKGNTTRFENLQTADVFLFSAPYTPQAYTRNSFIKTNGGHIRIHIYPNGHDTWHCMSMELIVNFADGTSQTISFDKGFSVNQSAEVADFFFDGSYKQTD